MIFAINLLNESDLREIIKREIGGDKFKLIDVDFIFNDFEVFVSNLRKKPNASFLYKDDGETFFNEEQKLTELSTAFINSEHRKKIKELSIEFKQPIVKELQDFLASEKQALNLIVTEKDTSVFEKLRIFLKTVAIGDSKNHGLSNLHKSFKIESLKSEDNFNLLLIQKFRHEKQESEELYNQLSNIIKNRSNQKIILIIEENDYTNLQPFHSLFKKNFESKCIEQMIKASDHSLLEKIVKGFLTPKKRIFNFIASRETWLSAIKVGQSLQHVSKNILDYEESDRCIFGNLKNLLNLRESIVLTFQSRIDMPLLAVECDVPLDGIEVHKLLIELLLVLAKNSNKQIILITKEEKALDNLFAALKKYFIENEFTDEQKKLSRSLRDEYEKNLNDEQRKSFEELLEKKYVEDKIDIDPKFSDLTDKSQNSLLEKEVIFQGQKMQLSNLIKVEDANSVIDSESLTKLVSMDEAIVIGDKSLDFSDLESAYHKVHVKIDKERLIENICEETSSLGETQEEKLKHDLFAVGGINKEDFSKFIQVYEEKICLLKKVDREKNKCIQFIIMPDKAEENFKKLCHDFPKRTIHFIEKKGDTLFWNCYYDPSFYISRCFDQRIISKEKLGNYNKENIHSNTDNLFAVSGIKSEEALAALLRISVDEIRSERDSNKPLNILVTDDVEKEFKELHKNSPGKSVHWLTVEGAGINKQLIWHRSYGKLDLLHKYITREAELDGEEWGKVKEILKQKNPSDLFVFSGVNKESISKSLSIVENKIGSFKEKEIVKPVILLNGDQPEEDFKELCKHHSKTSKPIHWLKVKEKEDGSKRFIWYRSRSTSNTFDATLVEGQLSKVTDKIMIIADEPGMGKSTTLTRLSEKSSLGQDRESEWIIRISLKDCKKQIEKELPDQSKKLNTDRVLEFLSQTDRLGLKVPLAKRLLKYRLEHQGKVRLLFDGFDEIESKHQRRIIQLLQFLKDKTQANAWITTRFHKREELENSLSVLAYTFEEFSIDNRKAFLKQFWKKSLKLKYPRHALESFHYEMFAEALLSKFFSNILGETEARFMGIPLQLRMLAEGFQGIFEEFCRLNQGVPEFENLNLLDLYQLFINAKYNIYFKEKTNLNDNLEKKNRLMTSFTNSHRRLAFEMLFSESKPQYVEELLQNKLPSLEKKKELNQVGIIQSTNNYVGFIHRTFAEYFAVDLLASWLERPDKYHKHPQEQELLLTQILIKPDYDVIRLFFNYKLKKIQLKPNTLTLYGTQIAKLWLDEPNRFRNEEEQTALHIASKESNTEIIDFLLNSFKGHYDTLKTLVVATDKYQNTALHLAVLENNDKVLERFLQGISNNSLEILKDLYLLEGGNTTVLHHAAYNAYLKCVKLLVEYNPYNNDIRDIDGNTPLGKAAKAGFFGLQKKYNEVIKILIKGGANPNIKDNVGFTPLNDAAYSNNRQGVEILLDNNATPNPDFKDSDIGVTPLHSAVLSGNLRIVELLLEKGAKPYFKSGKGGFLGKFHLTALHLAALLPSCVTDRLQIIKSLLKKDKSVINTEFNAQANDFKAFLNTIIDFAKLYDPVKKSHSWFKKGLQDILILTISKFCSSITLTAYDIAKKLDENETLTLLEYAGATKATSNTLIFRITSRIIFKVLKDYVIPEIKKNVWDKQPIIIDDELAHQDLTAIVDQRKQNILHMAAMNGDLGAVENQLNSFKKDPKTLQHLTVVTDGSGQTALHLAADRGFDEIVKQILASAKSISDDSKTLIDLVMIATYNSKKTALHLAAWNGYNEVVKQLLESIEKYPDTLKKLVSAVDRDDRIPLHEAAASGSLSAVKELLASIEKYPDTIQLVSAVDRNGRTLLHEAAESGSLDVVKELLARVEKYPNTHKQLASANDKDGRTPLHEAAASGSLDVVKELLVSVEKYPDTLKQLVSAVDKDGRTLLHEAAESGSLDVVRGLLASVEKYLDTLQLVSAVDKDHRTPLHEAAKSGSLDVVKKLLASVKKHPDTFKQLVSAADKDGKTPLHEAAKSGSLDVVEELLASVEKYPDTSKKLVSAVDKDGRTPLHEAAKSGSLGAVKELLASIEKHSDTLQLVSAVNKDGRTPLCEAVESGSLEVIKLLEKSNFDS